jgi:formyl-CoA transferase/CoA:oxalate CoA-transferase
VSPLDGILVVDFTRILAGPFCTMQLADMGARVIKIEPPGGDETRRWGPPFIGTESAYFLSVNRNKQSIVLDLRTDEGRALVHRFLERADVLAENFRPGTLDKWGLGYEEIHARYPRLVYASVSGYGQTGPRSTEPGFDLIAQGEGGVMSLTGPPDGLPYKLGTSQADLTAGWLATQGVLLALLARERTGEGQRVDVSLLDGQIAMLAYHVTATAATGQAPQRLGNAHPSVVPYDVFETADGCITVGVGTDAMWRALCEILPLPGGADDFRFGTNANRIAHRAALMEILRPLLRAQPTATWLTRLRAQGIPCGPVQSVPDALSDTQVRDRGMAPRIIHPFVGEITVPGIPIHLSQSPGAIRSAPPLLGQHTDELVAEFCNKGAGDIAALRSSAVIA